MSRGEGERRRRRPTAPSLKQLHREIAISKSHKNGVHRRRRYERTTPVGRLAKNVAKAAAVLHVCRLRLASWGAFAGQDVNKHLASVGARVVGAIELVDEAGSEVEALVKKGFLPPRKSSTVVFEAGDLVRIADKYREKYLLVYDEEIVDRLKVHKVLETGELAVVSSVRGKSAPFIVVKSHVTKRRGEVRV